jgi:hypothetical protein
MEKELRAEQSISEVREKFLHHFAELFGYSKIHKVEDGGWRIEDCEPPPAILDPRPPAF